MHNLLGGGLISSMDTDGVGVQLNCNRTIATSNVGSRGYARYIASYLAWSYHLFAYLDTQGSAGSST